VRNGGDVPNESDLQTPDLQTAQRSLATRAGSVYENRERLHALFRRHTRGVFSGNLRGERGALASALEALAASGRPTQHIPDGIGNGDDGVIERALDESHPRWNFPTAFFPSRRFLRRFFRSRGDFFLFALGGRLRAHLNTPLLLRNLELFADRNRLARTFASARVGVRALPADRETFAVTQTTIGLQIHEPLDILTDGAAKFAFYRDVFLDVFSDASDFVFSKLIGLLVDVDVHGGKDPPRKATANTENVSQTDFNPFVTG
jgi:hypothetical protein